MDMVPQLDRYLKDKALLCYLLDKVDKLQDPLVENWKRKKLLLIKNFGQFSGVLARMYGYRKNNRVNQISKEKDNKDSGNDDEFEQFELSESDDDLELCENYV